MNPNHSFRRKNVRGMRGDACCYRACKSYSSAAALSHKRQAASSGTVQHIRSPSRRGDQQWRVQLDFLADMLDGDQLFDDHDDFPCRRGTKNLFQARTCRVP